MTTFRVLFRLLCIGALAASLAACGKTKTYSSIEPGADTERSRSRLEVPPDLVDTTSDALLANQASVEQQSEQVLPQTESLDVERNDNDGWVEVGASPDKVWNRLQAHWGSLGVNLVVSDPTAGIMETGWVKPAGDVEENQSLTDRLIDQFLGQVTGGPTSLDKYTIQLERVGENRTRVNVSHRGRKKIQTQRGNIANVAQYEWVETEEDPAKIKRAMSSIVYALNPDSGAT